MQEKEIPTEARILAVCDAFDAMISERPYRKAMTVDRALAELHAKASKQFDPVVIDLFLRLHMTEVAQNPEENTLVHPSVAIGA